MKDIHCHLLYDIDDGPLDIEESKKMLKQLYYCGITDVVVTPHFINKSSYNHGNYDKLVRIKELEKYIIEEALGINLYIGNEIYLFEGILEGIKKDMISTINNSRYLLVEFPMNTECSEAYETLKSLIDVGAIPIIAHPERYIYYYNDFEFFESLINMGCLLQGNLGSLIGIYGKKCKIMLEQLLKRDMIFILATDAHRSDSHILLELEKAKKELFNLVGEERFKKLLETNFLSIINKK